MPAVGLRRRKIELLLEDLDQVPTLPGLACHVLSVVTNERPNPRDLQMAVEVDPALAAKLKTHALSDPAEARRLEDGFPKLDPAKAYKLTGVTFM